MKKVHFFDTVEIYYYNKDKPIQNSIQKNKVKTTKLYNLENNTINYTIIIMSDHGRNCLQNWRIGVPKRRTRTN